MSYEHLKIGKLVQTVLKPLIISKATKQEISKMQELEYSKATFGIQYPLLLKTTSSVTEKHYYSDLFMINGETYRLCCEWYETASNNDRPYVEKWIKEHETIATQASVDFFEDFEEDDCEIEEKSYENDFSDFFNNSKKEVTILTPNGTAIGEGQYKGRDDLIEVEIPEGVQCIGGEAFRYCNNLRKVVIPEGVRYIGRDAFFGCGNLKEVIIPDSVCIIEESCFENCESLEKIQLPPSLQFIGSRAFFNCRSLQNIKIPSQVRVIPERCFFECVALKEVELSKDIRVIMVEAFERCHSLSLISVKNCFNLVQIEFRAFASHTTIQIMEGREAEQLVQQLKSCGYSYKVEFVSREYYNPEKHKYD